MSSCNILFFSQFITQFRVIFFFFVEVEEAAAVDVVVVVSGSPDRKECEAIVTVAALATLRLCVCVSEEYAKWEIRRT